MTSVKTCSSPTLLPLFCSLWNKYITINNVLHINPSTHLKIWLRSTKGEDRLSDLFLLCLSIKVKGIDFVENVLLTFPQNIINLQFVFS